MQVETVSLAQPLELSVFSVDRSPFVDRPVESVARSKIFERVILRPSPECGPNQEHLKGGGQPQDAWLVKPIL